MDHQTSTHTRGARISAKSFGCPGSAASCRTTTCISPTFSSISSSKPKPLPWTRDLAYNYPDLPSAFGRILAQNFASPAGKSRATRKAFSIFGRRQANPPLDVEGYGAPREEGLERARAPRSGADVNYTTSPSAETVFRILAAGRQTPA
ncbi:hypothetical protein C8R46DRAFT_1214852 [Mycena filopes]|nr:hypothetical protein C8R46DRAFT_1214852 [Mycena filopes]